jgi:DNA-binding SARP family transcriptional activator
MPAPKQRVVLASLLLRTNQSVSVDELVEFVWDGVPPSGALVALRNHVMKLRRALGAIGMRIVTTSSGYLIEVRDGDLDLERFNCHHAEARRAITAGRFAVAGRAVCEALSLWREAPLQVAGADGEQEKTTDHVNASGIRPVCAHLCARHVKIRPPRSPRRH